MRIDLHGRHKWVLTLGISLLVNGILFAAAVKLLTALPSREDATIAVELTPLRPVRIIARPVPKKVIPPKLLPMPQNRVVEPPTPQPEPKPSLNPFRNLFQPRPAPVTQPRPSSAPTPIRPPTAALRPAITFFPSAHGGGSDSGSSGQPGGGGGGAAVTDPGGYTGSGSGGGSGSGSGSGSGHGTGTGSGSGLGAGSGSGNGNGDGHSGPAVPPPPPSPLKVEPKPKGETRGPQITRQSRPAYPMDAKDDGVEGTVALLMTIDRSGNVSHVKMENGSGDRRLDRAAEQSVKQWAYSPSLRDGEPVEATIRVRVQFRIE